MAKASKEIIRRRVAGQRRARAKRRRMARERVHSSMGPELAAKTRLGIDGCYGKPATRRRIQLIAHERKLPPIEIEKAMTCQLHHLGDFAKRHGLSVVWLCCGDLKGLKRMVLNQPPPTPPAIMSAADLIHAYARITPEYREIVTEVLQKMLTPADRCPT